MSSNNPLIQAYRKPALYVSLPSGGKYYDPAPELSVDGELAIYSMTARDELITKTPDALFNGEATQALLKSCCPGIKNPSQVPMSDLSVIMLGIRLASYGTSIEVDTRCPACNGDNQFKADGTHILAKVKPLEIDNNVILTNGFKVYVAPFSVQDRTNLQIQQIKQQKMMQSLIKNDQLDDGEREVQFGKAFVEIAEITVQVIANTIRKVVTTDDTVVEETAMIHEWLGSISKKDYDLIRERIEEMSKDTVDQTFAARCQHCGHEWDTEIELDQANFSEG